MTVETTGEILIISIRTKDPNNHSDTETGTLSRQKERDHWSDSGRWTVFDLLKDILIATASPSIDILFCIKTHWGHLSEFWKLFDWLYLIYVVLWTCADKGLSEYVDDKLKEIRMLLCKFLRQAANTHFLGSLIKRRGVGARGGKTEPKLGQSL